MNDLRPVSSSETAAGLFMKQIEFIVWDDADSHCDHPWRTNEEAMEFCETQAGYCFTIGFVLYETSESIYVTHTIADEQCGPIVRIPKVCIVKRSRVPQPKKETDSE